MMIAVAGEEMTCVACRFVSAPDRSPHGSLSYSSKLSTRRFCQLNFPCGGMVGMGMSELTTKSKNRMRSKTRNSTRERDARAARMGGTMDEVRNGTRDDTHGGTRDTGRGAGNSA